MITAIVLCFNEALHIERCLASLRPAASRIVVVDSGSTDGTREIAAAMGADVLVNAWINHATQFNWALDHATIATPWVLRLDADETLSPALAQGLAAACAGAAGDVNGFSVNRRIHFLGRWIRHGGIYPIRVVRIFRREHGRCEQRWMDEHIVVDGSVAHLDHDIVDRNLNDLTWWTAKHNGYASLEVIDTLLREGDGRSQPPGRPGGAAGRKRWIKNSVYLRLPPGVRPAGYFLYRYFFRLGLLDGWQGLVFHVLQGFWYRFLVDAKLMEIRALMARERIDRTAAIERMFGKNVALTAGRVDQPPGRCASVRADGPVKLGHRDRQTLRR